MVRPLGRQLRLRHRRGRCPALVAAGIAPRRAADPARGRWLDEHQNADGGWGEDLRSYDDAGLGRPGRVDAVADRLGAARPARRRATTARRSSAGIAWLVENQQADGGWDEELYTGTGFPGDFYINYEMYRLVFPLSALGRYVLAR